MVKGKSGGGAIGSKNEIVRLLSNLDFFESFGSKEKDIVADISEIVTESAGAQIVGAYEAAEYWFLVIEGEIEQTAAGEKTVTIKNKGHVGFENLVRN